MPNLGCVALQTPSISTDSISLTNRHREERGMLDRANRLLYSKVYLVPKSVEIIQ